MDIHLIGTNLSALVSILSGILISTCQLLAIFVISVGVIRGLGIFLRSSLFKPQTTADFQRSRLAMGYSFSLGLSFLVGGSILKTMLSSQWEDIARLVIIIAVRTALNLLLERAIRNSQVVDPVIDAAPRNLDPHDQGSTPETVIPNA